MAIPATTTEPRLRHEEKHQVNLREALVLSRRLEKLFPRDPHAGPEGSYQVVSLYYDDPYDTALRQKLDGMNRREKFRLRYYGKEPAFFKLEKKYKVKGLCGKGSCRLSREEGERLLRRDFAFLLEKEEPLAREFYAKLRRGLAPKTVVRYTGVLRQAAPGAGPQNGGALYPGGLSLRPGECAGHLGRGHPGRRAGAVPHPPKAAACPGGLGRGGSEIRRLSAGDCQAGGAGPQPAGDGLLQVRPVPPL